MTLEEEKKLVAEKLMGWRIELDEMFFSRIHKGDFNTPKRTEFWNPQSERKWWDEIWEKMDEKTSDSYLPYLEDLLYKNNDYGYTMKWLLMTAKPEICWKALIKTLESK